MMLKRNPILIITILILFYFSQNICADEKLLGYTHDDQHFISDAPLGHSNIWKAFRYQATLSGRADYFRMYLGGFFDTLETDNEVTWAIYEDNNNHVGTLKAFGYAQHYDWTVIGPGNNHVFPVTNVNQNRDIIAGNYYWVTFHATGGNNIQISRGRVSGCNPGSYRWATNQFSWNIFNPPPPPNEFINSYDQGCYGWAVWQSDSTNSAPGILNYIDDIVETEDFGSRIVADLDTIFFDADSSNGDSLRFTSLTLNGRLNSQISGKLLNINSIPNLNGLESVVVTATDINFASVSDTFLVDISPVPDPPEPFNLLFPLNGVQISSFDTLEFVWHEALDVDNDPLNYDLEIHGNAVDTTLINLSDTTYQFISAGLFQANSSYQWNVQVNDGIYSTSSIDTFIFNTTSINKINDDSNVVPDQFKLYQNYPNPFNPTTLIKYDLPVNSDVILKIFNLLGQTVFTYSEKNKSAGNYQLEFNANLLPSGIYIYQMQANNFFDTKKMILIQ